MSDHRPQISFEEFQRQVGEWGNRTFPHADNDSITSHLVDEVEELSLAAHVDSEGIGNVGEEAADCLMLLLHLAHRNGFSLFVAALEKFIEVQGRTWETVRNERGYFQPVDPAPVSCRLCGCTDDDCSPCVERTGVPCHWVEADLCSACAGESHDAD